MFANKIIKITILILFLILAFSQVSNAQNDSTKIMQVINRLFDGMRLGNENLVLSVFDSSAVLMSVGKSLGKINVHSDYYKAFAKAVGTPHLQAWDERIKNPVIHVDGDLATVWAEYSFYLGDMLNHCGIDSFQLIKRNLGWKILVIIDTRKKEDCDE
ncbi:MAG TPA: nuclear transport factor 2 family protein [Ignavibacteriaceae bacterium]|nr:nuclear transport factor 2 family protein [Ignavibacteriaceae bacterium]